MFENLRNAFGDSFNSYSTNLFLLYILWRNHRNHSSHLFMASVQITDIRIYVRNPRGRTRVEFDFDNTQTRRRQTLSDNHLTTRGGWVCCFTNCGSFRTNMNSNFKVDKKENGGFGKWNRGIIRGTFNRMGANYYEQGDVRLNFTVKRA